MLSAFKTPSCLAANIMAGAFISVTILSPSLPSYAQTSAGSGSAETNKPEVILVARSLRLTRITPTDYCRRAGDAFEATAEDTYHFFSITTRGSDGHVTEGKVSQNGELRACFGRTSTPGTFGFFAEGKLAGVTFKGIGDCILMKSIAPQEGISPFRCYLELSELPPPYVGGLLTTNTVNSRNMIGEISDPAGYTTSSIATVRLWRK